MDFQTAYSLGYYFDRCIDLEFYDSNRNFMAALKTPKRGMKPSITVKGELIEGSYAISSYISIQNMSYDININAVAYIKCTMYYSGLKEAVQTSYQAEKVKNGHTILFSVLYADQEKEPPNRAVRFQCTTAAFDYTRSGQEIIVDLYAPKGSVIPISFTNQEEYEEFLKNRGRAPSTKLCQIIDFLQQVAKAYNKLLKEKNEENSIRKLNLEDHLLITAIKYPSSLESRTFTPELGIKTIGQLLKDMNNIQDLTDVINGSRYKFFVYGGVIHVQKIPPDNWKMLAGNTVKSEAELSAFYTENYLTEKTLVRYISDNTFDEKGNRISDAEENAYYDAIKLNYVKSAYRNEVVIHAVTMFDDRIYPGCYCQISGNAIMGKHRAGGGKIGSRILNYTNENVIFRSTGGIQYEFSTTEDSSMTLTGPVVKEWSSGLANTLMR